MICGSVSHLFRLCTCYIICFGLHSVDSALLD